MTEENTQLSENDRVNKTIITVADYFDQGYADKVVNGECEVALPVGFDTVLDNPEHQANAQIAYRVLGRDSNPVTNAHKVGDIYSVNNINVRPDTQLWVTSKKKKNISEAVEPSNISVGVDTKSFDAQAAGDDDFQKRFALLSPSQVRMYESYARMHPDQIATKEGKLILLESIRRAFRNAEENVEVDSIAAKPKREKSALVQRGVRALESIFLKQPTSLGSEMIAPDSDLEAEKDVPDFLKNETSYARDMFDFYRSVYPEKVDSEEKKQKVLDAIHHIEQQKMVDEIMQLDKQNGVRWLQDK